LTATARPPAFGGSPGWGAATRLETMIRRATMNAPVSTSSDASQDIENYNFFSRSNSTGGARTFRKKLERNRRALKIKNKYLCSNRRAFFARLNLILGFLHRFDYK
jgi:hypothetical protein